MGTGWLAWTCLLLTAGSPTAADDIVHMSQRGFQIPIRIEAQRQADVKELLLYLSRDQGRTWEIYASAAPTERSFTFRAPSDGLFYFSIAVRDKKDRQDPVDIYHSAVGQKILIDTVKPDVKITAAERSGDEVLMSWEIHEEHPDWPTLRLEYRVGDSPNGQWTPLMLEPGERGNKRFRPGLPGTVTMRLSLKDLAGNEGLAERVLHGGHFDRAVVGAGAVGPAPTGEPPPPPTPMSSTSPPPPSGSSSDSSPPAPLAHSSVPGGRSASSSSTAAPSEPSGSMPTRGALPTLQIVNKRQVKLGFNVSRFGPSGLGTVDVYITTDEGATWQKSAADPNVSLPVSPERGAGPVRGTVTVSLPREGVAFGFYLVVKSRAGLGADPPRPGDPPHVRIELDTTPPDAQLMAPTPAPGHHDSLVLSWKAEDRNLAHTPVSLEWSPNANGPWTFIGDAQLPNSGKYIWTINEQVPPKVYLKLTVRDVAGNVAVAQTSQPVLIDLFKPEVEIGSVGVVREP
jgi:hypothetical protein